MKELKPCFQCGSGVELDWSGSTEYYGMNSQCISIICNEDNGHCCVDLSISVDTNKDGDYNEVENELVDCWNRICDLSNKG